MPDSSRTDGLDVTYGYVGPTYTANAAMTVTVPTTAASGPIRVVTTGGTSDLAGPAFAGITATAATGTPATAATPSANPGQAITITGTGLDSLTDVVFQTIDANGSRSQVIVDPPPSAPTAPAPA